MGPQKDAEVLASEVQKEAYLSRLPLNDQINLQNIGQGFRKVLEEERRHGVIAAVGGSINKPLPRKDIDLLIVLQPHIDDAQKGTSTELDFAIRDFQIFKHIVEKVCTQNPSLQIQEIIEPTMDEEFNSPSILKTDGSITVANKNNDSMPIELVRSRKRGSYQEVAAQVDRPFVILEHV